MGAGCACGAWHNAEHRSAGCDRSIIRLHEYDQRKLYPHLRDRWVRGTSAAPTDSSSNLYTLVASEREDDDFTTFAWVSFAPTVTSTMTFTIGGNVTLAEVSGWSGMASGPDAQSKSQDAYTTSLTSGNLAPTNANELLLSCFGSYQTQTNTVNSPMTMLDFIAGTGTHAGDSWINGGGLSYQIQTTKTTVNPTWPSGSYFAGAVVSASYFSTETPATLTITSTGVPEGFLSTAYSATNSLYSNILTATGGVQPYTWSCPTDLCPSSGSESEQFYRSDHRNANRRGWSYECYFQGNGRAEHNGGRDAADDGCQHSAVYRRGNLHWVRAEHDAIHYICRMHVVG